MNPHIIAGFADLIFVMCVRTAWGYADAVRSLEHTINLMNGEMCKINNTLYIIETT
ncbi:MAG: hypothetical protein FWE22_03475 [Firmicutes bacterium]|nr:hypothetical protein [Bacillota bacterium]